MRFMKINGIVIISLVALMIVLTAGCRNNEINGYLVDQPIKIDGLRQEWSDIPIYFNEENSTAYGICHDSSNIYLLFSFNDPIWGRMIKTKGLNIWINSENKQNKDFGISYSGGPNKQEMSKMQSRPMPMFDKQDQGRELPVNDSIMTIKMKGEFDQKVDIAANSDYAVAFKINKGICAYEFMIAKTDLLPEEINNLSELKALKIGLEWGGMDKSQRPKPNGGMRGGGGKAGGMGGGGMSGGGGMRGGGGGMNESQSDIMKFMEKQEIWISYKIAKTKE